MKLYADLFTEMLSSSIGLMSLIVILLIIVMAIYFTFLFMGKIKLSGVPANANDPAAQAAATVNGASTPSAVNSST